MFQEQQNQNQQSASILPSADAVTGGLTDAVSSISS